MGLLIKVLPLGSTGISRFIAVGSEEAPRQGWPPSAAQTGRAVFPHPAFTKAG